MSVIGAHSMTIRMNQLLVTVLLLSCSSGNGKDISTDEWSESTTPLTAAPPTDTAKRPLCHSHSSVHGHPLPLLDAQFLMTVEATIKQKNYTLTMELHYDYPHNQASLFISKEGVESRIVYNFPQYEGYFIQGTDCKTMNLRTRQGFQLLNYVETENGGHVSDVNNLFNFGTKYNEVYVKTDVTVRGLPVDQWTSCVQRDGVTFRLDYFFSKQNYSTPSGTSPVPIRAVLTSLVNIPKQATKHQTFEHVYDFVTYKPGPYRDQSFFRLPRGVVCARAESKEIQPTLPDHFSMGIEVIQPIHNLISFSKQYFDYTANLTRTDITPSSKMRTPMGDQYGHRPLKVIHDYSTGIQYVIDVMGENCSMRAIPNNSIDARTLSNDPTHVHMRHGADLFWLSTHDIKYQGKRTVRDVTCDVWAAVRPGWLKGVTTTMESCWAPKSQISGLSDEGDLSQMVLLQIWLHSANKTTNYSRDYISNMYNYHDDKPDLGLFDIGGCFVGGGRQIDIIFRVPGTMMTVVRHQPRHLQVAVRDAVSATARVSPIRVNSLFFEQTSPDFVDIWLTLYDAPEVKGNVDAPVPQVSLQTAYRNLERVINSDQGLVIPLVSDVGSKRLKVKKGSLKTDKDIDDPRLPFAYCDTRRCGTGQGHSSGSMAALGIMMVMVGVVLGLIGAFFLWKRGTGIPYQVQD